MKIIVLFFFFTLATLQGGMSYAEHDLHLSMCELRFNEGSSTFEVAVKIFIDDLELALSKDGVESLHIGTDKESKLADEEIASYIDRNFSIEIDGVKLSPDFLGKEISADLIGIWCFIEYKKDTRSGKKCIMTNRILLDLYSDQRNIMDIRMNKSHKDYAILGHGKTTWSYTY